MPGHLETHLNEADTRAQLIDPQLNRAGWTRSQVTREHYYRPDVHFTPGRVVLRGGRAERDKPRIMDYLLRYTDSFPIAVVEAKTEDVPAVAGLDESLTLEQYVDYSREKLLALMPGWEQMLQTWQDEALRLEAQEKLEQASVHPDVLAEMLKTPEADPLDVLGYVAYQRQPIPTRAERAERFMQQEQAWLAGFPPEAQVVLTAMMEKYRLGGLRQITDPAIFRLPPFKAMGELRGVSQCFGGTAALRQTMVELQQRLYSV